MRSRTIRIAAVAFLLAALSNSPIRAQTPDLSSLTPEQQQSLQNLSPEQLQKLNSLTPEQQQALQSLSPEQMQTLQNLPADQQKSMLDAMLRSSGAEDAESTSATRMGGRPRGDLATPGQSSTKPSRGPLRVAPRATLLIAVDIPPPPSTTDQDPAARNSPQDPTQKLLLQDRRKRILAGNPYTIDDKGRIALPTMPPIALGGLTAAEATQLLNADPRLAGLRFRVSLLPIAPVGVAALKPFGYDLFTGEQSSFAPATNLPVSADYPVGPGDTFLLELYGKRSGRYSLPVDRDGQIHLPDLGPMQVAGLAFERARSGIEERIANQMIGVRASVTMGPLRSIRIFVAGDVNNPGSYTVGALSTITNALFVSGGVSKVGSLRNVQLKRAGVVVGVLDIYALLLNGDSSGDRRLEPGDVVFAPPVQATAGADGAVRRPAIYEMRDGNTVADLIKISGGLLPEADPHAAKLERIEDGQRRTVVDVDLSNAAALATKLHSGDVLIVPQVLEEVSSSVTLEGETFRPGSYSWHRGMRLTELLSGLGTLKKDADQRYILIRREREPDRRVSVLSADAVQAFQAPGSDADPVLESRDRVIVFGLQTDRGPALADVLQDLRSQARDEAAPPVVSINGSTKAPGTYPMEPGMRISDLIRAGGGLEDAAYAQDAELTRYGVEDGNTRRTEVIRVDLAGVRKGDSSANLTLRPYDVLTIKEISEWAPQGMVTLRGEVRFPGSYPIGRGETLSSVIKRAGGLTPYAFPAGSVFTREEIREQERQQIENLARRMQQDLTTVALRSSQTSQSQNSAQALAIGENLLVQLRAAQPVGRLEINVENALAHPGHTEDDVELRGGDALIIPRRRQYVSVIGEVQNATSHIWKRDLSRDDYVQLSGGTTQRADKKRIYVVRADGSVAPQGSSRWFDRVNTPMRPGDTVIVPLDAERMPPLPMWQAVTQILYNLAVAVAAIHAL